MVEQALDAARKAQTLIRIHQGAGHPELDKIIEILSSLKN